MKSSINKYFLALTLAATCGFALIAAPHSHRGFNRYYANPRPVHITKVVTRPVVVARTTNRLSQAQRQEMAIAYIKANGAITVAQYSKITGLRKATAEAELNAFVNRRNSPIVIKIEGKKKLYVLA